MKILSIFSSLAFLFLPLFVLAQQEVAPQLSVSELQEDFTILRRNLEDKHIGLYTYTTKEEMDQVFDKCYQGINRKMTAIEFYRHVGPLLGPIGNGHTDIEIPQEYLTATQSLLPRLPLSTYYDQGNLYILKNSSNDDSIESGSILKSVNGESAIDLWEYFMRYQTRDGFNRSLPENACAKYFSLHYAYTKGTPASYEIELINSQGAKRSLTIEGLPLPKIRENAVKRYGASPTSFWADKNNPASSLTIEGEIATLTIRTFDAKTARKRGQPFKRFLNESFAKIKAANVQHLILDLRDNGGGDPMPTVELFSHLYEKPFTFYREVSAMANKFEDGQYYDAPIWLLNLQGKLRLKKQGAVYLVKNMDGTKEAKPAKDVFTGELYVLTSPNSFSATGEMTAIIKEHRDALFIGEEAGGNPNQNTSGMMLPLLLPNSKLRVTVPIILWKMNVNFTNTGHGILPDHPVRNSWQDQLDGLDRVMIYTLDLIKNGSSK